MVNTGWKAQSSQFFVNNFFRCILSQRYVYIFEISTKFQFFDTHEDLFLRKRIWILVKQKTHLRYKRRKISKKAFCNLAQYFFFFATISARRLSHL